MKPNHKPKITPSDEDLRWAKEAVKDLFFGCVLNITLKTGGVCHKYLYEMTESEVLEYLQMVSDLFDVKKKY